MLNSSDISIYMATLKHVPALTVMSEDESGALDNNKETTDPLTAELSWPSTSRDTLRTGQLEVREQ
jgi:hypothetical protein